VGPGYQWLEEEEHTPSGVCTILGWNGSPWPLSYFLISFSFLFFCF
jgi:hypothetical protein